MMERTTGPKIQYSWAEVKFEMELQCHQFWCWAAVASSVSKYYDKKSTFEQCTIANIELDRTDCCDVPCHQDDVDFDRPNTLGSPLNEVGCLHSWIRKSEHLRTIDREITKKERPVCLRTVWSDGEAHFVAIVGVDRDNKLLKIADPLIAGNRVLTYAEVETNYPPNHGVWKDTFFTKP
jgi:hypothetical protein